MDYTPYTFEIKPFYKSSEPNFTYLIKSLTGGFVIAQKQNDNERDYVSDNAFPETILKFLLDEIDVTDKKQIELEVLPYRMLPLYYRNNSFEIK